MAISSISKMRELFWFKKLELEAIEDGLHKVKSILGEDRIYQVIPSHDNAVCITISENFTRKCRIVMTTNTVDIFTTKELEVWYEFTEYMSNNFAVTKTRPEVLEAISRDLFSIVIDEEVEKCSKNLIVLKEIGENDYGRENDERVYYITTSK